nr:hypothetical protein [uncultured Anaeromusa sp.]
MEKKFYQTIWFAWVMVIFFFPVGLFLLWKYKHHSTKVRLVVTGVFLVLVLFNGIFGDKKNTAPAKQQPVQAAQVADKATQQADFKKWKASIDAQLKDADAIWEKWTEATDDFGKGKINKFQAYERFKAISATIDKQDSKITSTKPPATLSKEDQKILNSAVDNLSSTMSYRKMATDRLLDMIDNGDYKPSKAESVTQTIKEGNGYMVKAASEIAAVQVGLGINNN